MPWRFFHSSMYNGQILFHRDDKEIWWSYSDEVRVPSKHHAAAYRIYANEGKVPDEVVSQGDEAIHEFAQMQVDRWLARRQKEEARISAYLKNPNVPIETEIDGIQLRGRIISAEDSALTVRLEDPFVGQATYVYSFAAAMQGKHMFDGKGNFSAHALEKAKSLLRSIYTNRIDLHENREWVEMVRRLNSK